MKEADLQVYKQRLLSLRARLRGDVSSVLDASISKEIGKARGKSSDLADQGSENWDQELALSITQNEEETLDLINAALRRIEEGTYGYCVGSGAKIPKSRLNAIPFTPYCVDYAAKIESGEVILNEVEVEG